MSTDTSVPSTEAHAHVTVSVDSGTWGTLGNLGTFEVMDPGEAGGEVTKYTPGGQADEVVIPGRKTHDDMTVNRVWKNPRDRDIIGPLLAARARAKMTVSEQPLDADYNPLGSPIVTTGLLMGVTRPGRDSDSTDPARLVLTMSVGKVAA